MRDTASNQSNQKPTYKDYQSFLQIYGNQSGSSNATISPTSSSSSLQSSENDGNGPRAYNEFLQNYGTKKFGSVRMKHRAGSVNGMDEGDSSFNPENSKKVVRSELVINITAPDDFKPPPQKLSPKPFIPQVSSPKTADNSTIPDEMIYAKTVVLKELLSKSPSLKKPPQNHTKTTNPKSIYHKLEQFTNGKEKNLPPPLPNTKPPIVRRNSANGSLKSPISPKPPVPQKTFLKTDDLKRSNSQQKDERLIQFLQKQSSGINNDQDAMPNTTTIIPTSDPTADINKNDPNVKKMVYNTYRGLLGAYNNKANNMVSTLPRNFVVQDRGVIKQVESIESQGCLANLNGRINPNPED